MAEHAIAAGGNLQLDSDHVDITPDKSSFTTDTTLPYVPTEVATLQEGDSNIASTSCIEREEADSQAPTPNLSTALVATQERVIYRSAGVQTLPPGDGNCFRKVYDRVPTHQELVEEVGCAALGRYRPTSSPRPYDVVLSTPFPTEDVSNRQAKYIDSSYQTLDVAQCKKALVRAKVKASLLVSKQRDAALSAGFRVWSETRDDHIVHSEQNDISIQFDDQGNATNANVDGLSLPNIYGEEMDPPVVSVQFMQPLPHPPSQSEAGIGKEARTYTSSATSTCTPPPTPPSRRPHDVLDDVNNLQRIRTVGTRTPCDQSDPPSIEHYGYVQFVPKEAAEQDTSNHKSGHQQQGRESASDGDVDRKGETVMVIGGERFADEYIIHDTKTSNSTRSATLSESQSNTKKKRKSADQCEPESATISPKRLKSSAIHTDPSHVETSIKKDHSLQDQNDTVGRDDAKVADTERIPESADPGLPASRQDRFVTTHQRDKIQRGAEDDRHSRSPRPNPTSRRRSRSPVVRPHSDHYRSRSSTRRPSEKPHEEDRRPHGIGSQSQQTESSHQSVKPGPSEQRACESEAQLQTNLDAIVLASKEEDRRLVRARQMTEEKLAKRRQREEFEIQRAREAKNQRKLEIEEKKRIQGEECRRQGEERTRQHRSRRDESQDRSRKLRQTMANQPAEPVVPVDEYVLAREVEARRREKLFATRSTGKTESRIREGAPTKIAGVDRLEVEQAKPEKKMEDNKVTKSRAKSRPSRTARGEIVRYDPRKRFGRGDKAGS
jgi:hypothetical protein